MRDHDHDHPHFEPGRLHHHHGYRHLHHTAGASGYGIATAPAAGHNAAAQVAQWQEPHPHGDDPNAAHPEPDFDLVEASFAESFPKASDPTSFLRLARIPFVGRRPDGRVLRLLRVEYEQTTDVGTVTPHVGGATLRYDPLPAPMISRRRRLAFVYQDGAGIARLSLAETRSLEPE